MASDKAREKADHLRALSDTEIMGLAEGRRRPADSLMKLWLKPIAGPFGRISETFDKPIGQLTVPEALDWVYVLAYASMTGYIIGKAISNLAEVALDGRRH